MAHPSCAPLLQKLEGMTALMCASLQGELQVIEALLPVYQEHMLSIDCRNDVSQCHYF